MPTKKSSPKRPGVRAKKGPSQAKVTYSALRKLSQEVAWWQLTYPERARVRDLVKLAKAAAGVKEEKDE